MNRGLRDLRTRITALIASAAVAVGLTAGLSAGMARTVLAAETSDSSASDSGVRMEMLDPDATGSIGVTIYGEEAELVPGGTLTLYKVADVVVDNGFKFVYAAGFETLTAPLIEDSDLTADLAQQAAAAAEENGASSVDVQVSDDNGHVTFANLPVGLYLVVETAPAPGYLPINPFLVTVPTKNYEKGTLEYNVDAFPKPPIAERETTTTVTTEVTTTDRIPQTGQQWLPVWVLGGLGVLLVVFGLFRRHREDR